MNLLDKFSSVEIKADSRISAEDAAFCRKHQEAFDKSGPALQKLADMMDAVKEEQRGILDDGSDNYFAPYVYDCVDADRVYTAIRKRNSTFIEIVTNYFAKKYNVTLDRLKIQEHLIPQKPEFAAYEDYISPAQCKGMTQEGIQAYRLRRKQRLQELDAWEQSLLTLPLRYEQIVDEIFVQLGGFSFTEQARNELLEKCWNSSHHRNWHSNVLEENFEVKNDTLKLTDYWCHYDAAWSTPKWSVTDGAKTVLDALAHYISDQYGVGHKWFPELYGWNIEGSGVFPICHPHVKQIKLFKNGRMDIKFRSAQEALEFADTYLRKDIKGGSAA